MLIMDIVEERHLIAFFGKDYKFYRTYTAIGIPLIWSREYPELEKPDWDEHMQKNEAQKDK
jgi:hypothetical protein